jgi:hypothetical protein
MKTKTVLMTFMVLLVTTSALCAGKYSDAKEQIGKWNVIMLKYTAELDNLEDLAAVTKTCDALANDIKAITPAMQEIRMKYPELATAPPDEMRGFMTDHRDIEAKFNNKLKELMKVANEHSENQEFQQAFGKLNMAVYKMKR